MDLLQQVMCKIGFWNRKERGKKDVWETEVYFLSSFSSLTRSLSPSPNPFSFEKSSLEAVFPRPSLFTNYIVNPFGHRPGTCHNCSHARKSFLCVLISWYKGLRWLHERQCCFPLNSQTKVGAKAPFDPICSACSLDKSIESEQRAFLRQQNVGIIWIHCFCWCEMWDINQG